MMTVRQEGHKTFYEGCYLFFSFLSFFKIHMCFFMLQIGELGSIQAHTSIASFS